VVKHVEGSGHSDSLLLQSAGYSQVYNNYVEESADQNIYIDNLLNNQCAHIRIYNNVLNSDQGFGIILDPEGGVGSAGPSDSGCTGASVSLDDVVIANNTFVIAQSAQTRKGRSNPITNTVIKNNIYGGGQTGGTLMSEIFNSIPVSFLDANAWDYDVYAGLSSTQITNFSGSNQTLAQIQALGTPREVHGTMGSVIYTGNFQLAPSDTAAKGQGVNLGATYPFLANMKDGTPRTVPWNRGAF
jgi:hypothetical protein